MFVETTGRSRLSLWKQGWDNKFGCSAVCLFKPIEYFSRLRDVLILNEATRAGTTVGPIGKSLGEPSGVIEFVKNFGVMVRSSISETSSAVSRLATRIKTIVKTKDRGISLSSHGLNDAEFTKRYRFVMGSVYAALLYIAANKLFLPPEPPKRLPPPPEMLQLSSASDLMRQLFSAEGNDGALEDLKYGKDTSGAYRKGDIEIELDSDEYDEDLLDEEYDDDHDDFDLES
ncbi:hypothetical protein AX774_g3930 [Zancudomyces culisetae]|uniref:Uncharacterized protein n=1 Tax=Zancudomyces culisetae TaxID=1213189 RepID=A0A1R1PGR4_ZANCU|nr:hypothetical protein AX774_g6446 [Zancudomyces culisetae]OMH82578.1 hypothetical protein AX774_g3930 [Zancudomyces culisetae]|eukprot:OMH80119.1 hypothetical protein AX774_g6446 [Zancudomyces culisetae]